MLWISMRSWAPNFVVTVQSKPSYLIEIGLFCIVAAILCATLFLRRRKRSWPFSDLLVILGDGSTPAVAATGPLLYDAREAVAADDGLEYLPADEGAGDGDAVRAGWLWPDDDARGATADSTADVVHVLCADCHRAHRGRQDGGVASPTSEAPREEEDVVVVEELPISVDDESSSSSSSVDAYGMEVDAAVVGDREDDDEEEKTIASAQQGGMVEFVAARYRGFKEAALAGRLLVVDPAAQPLLSESGLVAILSHALKSPPLAAPVAKRRGFPGG